MAAGAVERILLGLLLEKYEGSKVCLAHPEKATVLPQINFENSYKKKLNQKKSKYKMEKLLDYQTTNSSVLHAYNEAAEHLQQLGFLQIEYDSGGAMLKVLRLQLLLQALFIEPIGGILQYGVTIEQEIFYQTK